MTELATAPALTTVEAGDLLPIRKAAASGLLKATAQQLGLTWQGCIVYKSANQALVTDVETVITFDTVLTDVGGWHTSNNYLEVITGVTRIRAGARLSRASLAGQLILYIKKNGVLSPGLPAIETDTAGLDNVTGWSASIPVVPTDQISCVGYMSGAGNILGGATESWFAIEACRP